AIKYYKLAADQEDATGQLYYADAIFEQDPNQAARYYKLSAAQGNIAAQCGLERYREEMRKKTRPIHRSPKKSN
ncbi:MAG: hypothetical protein LBQ43_02090, partial [Holosporales bacterium]|nr:hypothetical protein [Holosporales bacterium]